MAKPTRTIIDPSLLRVAARQRPLEVFLCGPGEGHSVYKTRQHIRDHLASDPTISVRFGEELEALGIPEKVSRSKIDLQSLESAYAHTVDFTVLLLESPGSMAELGTFSMIQSIRPRLYVLVSDEYYNSNSYISRGPLSILANEARDNVIYYARHAIDTITGSLARPIAFYKFARWFGKAHYEWTALDPKNRDEYYGVISHLKREFDARFVLAAINVLPRPTFSELTFWLGMHPEGLSASLRQLHERSAISKSGAGYYRPSNGLEDGLLDCFDMGKLSKRRAELIAQNAAFASALA